MNPKRYRKVLNFLDKKKSIWFTNNKSTQEKVDLNYAELGVLIKHMKTLGVIEVYNGDGRPTYKINKQKLEEEMESWKRAPEYQKGYRDAINDCVKVARNKK